MTISSETRVAGPYPGNGVTTSFPFSFKVFSSTDVVVVLTDPNGVETTLSGADYSVAINADQDAAPGGAVEKTPALSTGYLLTITSSVPNLQPLDLTNQGGFYPKVINAALDRLTVLVQQVAEQVGRAVKVGISSSATPDELIESINAAAQATQDAAAAAEAAAEAFGEGGILAVEFGGTNADTAAGARTNLGAQVQLVSGTNIKTINGESLLGSGNITIDTSDIFDQLALTNLRLLLNTGVTTGALAQGRQWELATDEWGATSTDETYVAPGSFGYYTNGGGTAKVPNATAIGNLTGSGGLAAAFDGNTNQATSSSAGSNSATPGTIGQNWGAAKTIGRFRVFGPNNAFTNTSGSGSNTCTFKLQGSNDGSAWTDLYSSTVADAVSLVVDVTTGIDTSSAYSYHRVTWQNANNATYLAEVEFYEITTPANITLIPPASVSVATAPAYVSAYMLYKDDSGSAVLGTDLTVEISRDGGTTYTAAAIATVASFDGTYSAIKARADVSAQPSGTSLLMRVKTLNSKAQRIAAPAIYAE